MWKKPWGIIEGSAIGAGLLLTGVLLQLTIGGIDWALMAWPVNIFLVAIILMSIGVGYALRGRIYALRFMITPQAAVPAVAFAALLTVIMGLVKQLPPDHAPTDPLGFSRMLSSWPFILTYLWATLIVGLATVHQLIHFRRRALPAIISHLGLFLVVVCGTLGSADMQRLKMYCMEGQPEWRAFDSHGTMHELPLALQLNRFSIDEYPPKLVIVDNKNNMPLSKKPQTLLIDDKFQGGTLGSWSIKVTQRFDEAAPRMVPSKDPHKAPQYTYKEWKSSGAECALHVEAVQSKTGRKVEGWVTGGSYMYPAEVLRLNKHVSLATPPREPQRFASEVEVFTKQGKHLATTIEVNKPFSVAGWKIYQLSYDEQMGKWSNMSIFELVTDPWLPMVYIGIFLMLAGAILMFVFAQRRKEEKPYDMA
ncbi:cytochrome c biogenesis protein ResB [Prevotella sp. S7 MS 2]|uniref:cytochrome c biogenesis protein ResB n=1 Tax=Prevotella sp. S7 MS 2 TaxID=1287488 RepID=UPI000513C512|nr:cytochrome c biogenesis protein ResB [Prevotella sp. S7 MS 2]KGI61393.1 membrane protein [Prevotella sp. S7 MS 2]